VVYEVEAHQEFASVTQKATPVPVVTEALALTFGETEIPARATAVDETAVSDWAFVPFANHTPVIADHTFPLSEVPKEPEVVRVNVSEIFFKIEDATMPKSLMLSAQIAKSHPYISV
jgi:hypothetical protein